MTDFDQVSGRIGKEAGDRLLASVASRLAAMTREADTLRDMRDHDFAILMPSMESEMGLNAVVSKVRTALRVPFTPEFHFGSARYPADGDEWVVSLRRPITKCC